jgi:hypothetical protein
VALEILADISRIRYIDANGTTGLQHAGTEQYDKGAASDATVCRGIETTVARCPKPFRILELLRIRVRPRAWKVLAGLPKKRRYIATSESRIGTVTLAAVRAITTIAGSRRFISF